MVRNISCKYFSAIHYTWNFNLLVFHIIEFVQQSCANWCISKISRRFIDRERRNMLPSRYKISEMKLFVTTRAIQVYLLFFKLFYTLAILDKTSSLSFLCSSFKVWCRWCGSLRTYIVIWGKYRHLTNIVIKVLSYFDSSFGSEPDRTKNIPVPYKQIKITYRKCIRYMIHPTFNIQSCSHINRP